MRRKVFCVGLHKAGTTSIHAFFSSVKLRSTHSTDWSRLPLPKEKLARYDAFSDGGGHFWDDRMEFGSNHELRALRTLYPDCRFILQYRPLRPWLVSKMLHAGWRLETVIVPASGPLSHDRWKEKSLEALHGWVDNRLRYHRAASDYLATLGGDVLCIDVTSDRDAAAKVADFALGPGRYRLSNHVNAPLRALNRLRPTFVPATMPRMNAASAGPEDKARCEELAHTVLAAFGDRPDLDAPHLARGAAIPA